MDLTRTEPLIFSFGYCVLLAVFLNLGGGNKLVIIFSQFELSFRHCIVLLVGCFLYIFNPATCSC